MTKPTIVLSKGAHPADAECADPQRCLFEWYNWITRRAHTDSCPPGVSPVLHVFGMRLNDALPDDRRQQLVRFLPNGEDRFAGTADDGKDEVRSYMALDWLIRTYTPAFLDLAVPESAAALRDLRRIVDLVAAQSAGPVVRAASSKAAAAGDAAWDAAWDAAGDAAWDAAWDAAGDAARAAAWDAAWAAAGDAAWDAARAAAGDAAWSAAWAAARDAARDAAWAAVRAAVRDAAWAALTPTVTQLQDSAISLFDLMISGVWPDA
jgi:hypothetical protein